MRAFAVHDPDAILNYAFDWSAWLADGATISTSTWDGPDGLTLTASVDGTNTIVKVQVTDSSLLGSKVDLVNHVTSSDGQEDDRTLRLYISQR